MVLAAACGTAAEPTTAPTQAAQEPAATSPPEATPTTAPLAEPTEAPVPTANPQTTVTPLPADVVSARDSITLVVGTGPLTANPMLPIGAGTTTPMIKDTMVDPLTWQSGDDLRIVPTTASTGWEQLAPDTWCFTLRQGVKFHNGEAWNAQAALPSLEFQGTENNINSNVAYTGTFEAEAVDEYTLDIICNQPCPIFPRPASF